MTQVFESVDTDGSGEIEYSEFLAAAMQKSMYASDQAVLAAFRVFDVDGDGRISMQELARIVDTEDLEMPGGDLARMDGAIDLQGFRAMLGLQGAEGQRLGRIVPDEAGDLG